MHCILIILELAVSASGTAVVSVHPLPLDPSQAGISSLILNLQCWHLCIRNPEMCYPSYCKSFGDRRCKNFGDHSLYVYVLMDPVVE